MRMLVALMVLTLLFTGCKPTALPESGSLSEELYVDKCGRCHSPYHPNALTSAMWAEQVEAMQLKMSQMGFSPLNDAERVTILNYLRRNAGGN
jgi:Dihaem cytochrome c